MQFDFTKEPGRRWTDRGLDHSGEPLVSIITPYYNAGTYFPQTFRSVINQSFPWFEWIIVDDGSTDAESISVLREYAAKDDRVRVFRQENGGQASARNTGIRNSAAEIVVPLDADDLIAPPFLEELFYALKTHPEAAWAYTDSVGFGEQEYLWKKSFSAQRMKSENILVCTAGIRREWLERTGGYEESTKLYDEDWQLWLRLLSMGAKPVHLAGCLFWYRRISTGAQQAVQRNRELRAFSQEKIREAAKEVRESVTAIEYPRSAIGGYHPPKASNWERKVFSKHEKLHVLLLLPWMEMGGADRFNLEICEGLDKARYELGIITTQPGENSWQQRFAEHVTDIFNLPDFLDMENWAEFISYYIRSREVDLLFVSNSYYGYYLLPWLRKEFPDLAIMDYVHMEEWYWRNGGYARTSGAMGEILEKTCVCNDRTRQVLLRDFGRSAQSVETLYIGVDHEKFDPDKVLPGAAKARLGIGEDRPMILFPCRLHPQKRPFLMLEIAKELRKTLPEAAFAVVGDGPQLEELRAKVNRDGLQNTVFFAERQSDMLPWYRDAALTLICSLKEGLALTACESLSMGVPVITSDVGGQRELIDESVGRVLPLMQSEEVDLDTREFRPEEIRQYVDAITSLLSDGDAYGTMSLACRRRIEESFSLQRMIGKLEKAFESLVSDPVGRESRRAAARELGRYPQLIGQLSALMTEIEGYEQAFKNAYATDTRSELMRIANSKWGRRAIRLAFKLKLNKLFH